MLPSGLLVIWEKDIMKDFQMIVKMTHLEMFATHDIFAIMQAI